MSEPADRGRRLEEDVASHFAAHGYRTRRNVVSEGRSGARHEVDVLAETADPLTTYRLAVECKAGREPVEQDVVSKLAWVVADLGLHKGILVAPAGATAGAARAATRLGVELWGPDEVALRLGPAGTGEPAAVVGLRVLGLPAAVGPERAGRAVRRARTGLLRGARESLVASTLAWVPVWELGLTLSRSRGRGRGQEASRAWHAYEALAGALVEVSPAPAPAVELQVSAPVLVTRVGEGRLAGDLRRAVARLAAVTTEAAVARHEAILAEMGVPGDTEHVEVESARLIHLPAHLALLRRRDVERVVAVDARTGALSAVLGASATTAVGAVAAALGWPR